MFKTFRFNALQMAMFKVSLLAFGIAIGAFWSDVFSQYMTELLGVGAIAGIYVWFVWSKQ